MYNLYINFISKMQDQQKGAFPLINVSQNERKALSPFTWTHIRLPQIDISRVSSKKAKEGHNKKKKSKEKTSKEKHVEPKIRMSADYKLRRERYGQMEELAVIKEKRKSSEKHKKVNKQRTNLSIDEGVKKKRKLKEDKVNKTIDMKRQKEKVIEEHLRKKNQFLSEDIMNDTGNKIRLGRLRSPLLHSYNTSVEQNTYSFNKIQPFVQKSLFYNGWLESKGIQTIPQLIWTNLYYHSKLIPGQIHNHVKNGHLLTTKNHLHECQSAFGSAHYPSSFLLPQQYDTFCSENQQNYIKITLKELANEILVKGLIEFTEKVDTCLGKVLPEITQSENPLSEESIIILRLCMYLQNYRKNKNYKYFQSSENYINVQIQLKSSIRISVLKFCYNFTSNNSEKDKDMGNFIQLEKVQKSLLLLLWFYHCLIKKYQPSYFHKGSRNVWIVKPIASSRGAGIFLFPNGLQFTTILNENEYSNKSKYTNKIIQKYVENPLLLSKPEAFAKRKFDIRQWVLLTSKNGEPMIYIYESAYCRFSDLDFTYSHKKRDEGKIHLTNYSKSDKNRKQESVLMLDEVFACLQMKEAQQKYEEQLKKIVVQSILNTPEIKFDPGYFQFLGYDLLLDDQLYLWLLEINVNPACDSTRRKTLETEANKMVTEMVGIVKNINDLGEKKPLKTKWKQIYGKVQEQFSQFSEQLQVEQADVKPYYSIKLSGDSLMDEVIKRNFMGKMIDKVTCVTNLWQPWKMIQKYAEQNEKKVEEDQESEEKKQNKEIEEKQ